jgi:hypothetical protein
MADKAPNKARLLKPRDVKESTGLSLVPTRASLRGLVTLQVESKLTLNANFHG